MEREQRAWLKIRWPRASSTVIGVIAALFAFALFALYDFNKSPLPSDWASSPRYLFTSLSTGAMFLQMSVINLLLQPSLHSLGHCWSTVTAVLGPNAPIIACIAGISTAGWSVGLLEEDRGGKAAVTLVLCATAVGGVAALLTQQSGIAASPVAFCAMGALLYTRRDMGVGLGEQLYLSGPAAHLLLAGLSLTAGLSYGLSYLLTIWASWFVGAWLANRWGDEVSILPHSIDLPIRADGLVGRVLELAAPKSAWSLTLRRTFIRGKEASALAAHDAVARARSEAAARFDAWKDSGTVAQEPALGSPAALNCEGCGAPTKPTDLFCPACGMRTARRVVLRPRSTRGDRRATKTLCGIAAYFALVGFLGSLYSSATVEETLETGSQYAAHEEVVLETGEVVLAGEWREELEREPYLVLIVYGAVAALFLVLGLWARWSPFAALCVGAGIFASMVVLAIVGAPELWHQGLLLRVVIAVALVRGIQQARTELRSTVQTARAY